MVLLGDWDPRRPWEELRYQDGVFDEEGERVYVRMNRIAEVLVEVAVKHRATHAWIEQYGFGIRKSSSMSVLMELGGSVKGLFQRQLGMELAPVTASSSRSFMLGKIPRGLGKGGEKVWVQGKVYGMGAPRNWTDNAVDALVVANHGRGELGLPALIAGG